MKRPGSGGSILAETGDNEAGPTRLSSVTMAMRVLKSFSEGEAEIGITALSRKLGIAKSTAYRLASTLVAEGMLEQNRETEKYRLGLALFGLGALVRQRMDVSTEARQPLFALREATGETVHLAILDGSDIMYVLNLESNHAIRMRADLGSRKPAFCTAEGLAMLAFASSSSIEAVMASGLRPRTPRTEADPTRLRARLDQVRRLGYAMEDEESETGMRSLAAPIRRAGGDVVAAIGLAGPVQRLPDDLIAKVAPQVVRSAALVSARLGHRSRQDF